MLNSVIWGEILMTYRQIETSRELRLWIKDVIFPCIIIGVIAYKNKDKIKEKADDIISKFKAKHE